MASEGAGGRGLEAQIAELFLPLPTRLTATDRAPRGAAGGGPAGPLGLGGACSLGRARRAPTPLTKKARNLPKRESKQEGGVTLKRLKRASAVLSTFTPISCTEKHTQLKIPSSLTQQCQGRPVGPRTCIGSLDLVSRDLQNGKGAQWNCRRQCLRAPRSRILCP